MGHKRKAQDSWLSVHWPMIFLGTAALAIALVGLLAGAIPGYRASRVEPIVALRHE